MSDAMPERCEYIGGKHLQPGWACGFCRTYNGLQRQNCKACNHLRCTLTLPDDIVVCSGCGFGEERSSPMTKGICPVCGSYLYKHE